MTIVDGILLLAHLMGQHCFAGWRLSSSVVVVCRRLWRCRRGPAAGRMDGRRPGAWAVGRPTLHGGPVVLRPIRSTLCLTLIGAISLVDDAEFAP